MASIPSPTLRYEEGSVSIAMEDEYASADEVLAVSWDKFVTLLEMGRVFTICVEGGDYSENILSLTRIEKFLNSTIDVYFGGMISDYGMTFHIAFKSTITSSDTNYHETGLGEGRYKYAQVHQIES